MRTEFKPVPQVAACSAEDHEVSVDASAEQLKAIKPRKSSSLNVSILNTSRSGHVQHSQRSMKILRSGMQRPSGEQHDVRPPLRRNTRILMRNTLEHQAETEAEFHDEEAKAADLRNRVQMANKSLEEQQHQVGTEFKEAKLAGQNSFSVFKTWCENIEAQKESDIQSRTLRVETLNSDTELNEIAIDVTKKVRRLFEMPENRLEWRTLCKSARRRTKGELQESTFVPS